MIGIFSYLVFFSSVVLINIVLALGLNLQWGYTGLFNAGVVGFYAVGAYAHAILTAPAQPGLIGNFNLPWVVGLAGAMAASGFVALVVGLVTIRLRDDYLAITTFGIATVIQLVCLNSESLTGGGNGFSNIPRPLAASINDPFWFNLFYLFLLIALVTLIYWALQRILNSPWGRVLRAIAQDEAAARSLGKSAVSYRLQAFVLGSALMGLAGALYVSLIGFVSPFDFLPILTFQIWAMVIVGGSGNNLGVMLGTLCVWALWSLSGVVIAKIVPPALAAQGGALQVILIGSLLVLSLLFRPQGLLGQKGV